MQDLFKALGDPTRRAILEMLKVKDLNAGEISEAFNMSKPSISHHLELLHRANLVSREKQGQFVVYTLNTIVFQELLQWIVELKSSK